MERQRLTILYTGNGKGKTTAALGQALRAVGQGLRVCIVQFIKGKWPTGEAKAWTALGLTDFHVMGAGFTWQQEAAESKRAAEAGWALAEDKILGGAFDLVVLDELTYLIRYGLVAEERILAVFQRRPAHVHLVITGRNASPALIEAADLVTEMREVKHPYAAGIKAQAGIEF